MLNLQCCRRQSGVYIIINTKTQKFYIGSSVNMYNRIHEHIHNLRFRKHHNQHLQSSFNKYGIDAFTIIPYLFCNKESRIEEEQKAIDLLKPAYNKNLVVDEPFSRIFNEEQRKWQSEDRKKKFKAGIIAIVPFAVAIIQYSIDGKKQINTFESLSKASASIGGTVAVAKCISKKTYLTGGFQWRKKGNPPRDMTSMEIGKGTSTRRTVLYKETKENRSFMNLKEVSEELNIKYKALCFQFQKHGHFDNEKYYINNI